MQPQRVHADRDLYLEAAEKLMLGSASSPLDRETAADALQAILGEPIIDHVTRLPIAVWDKLRDLLTRVERLEGPGLRAGDTLVDFERRTSEARLAVAAARDAARDRIEALEVDVALDGQATMEARLSAAGIYTDALGAKLEVGDAVLTPYNGHLVTGWLETFPHPPSPGFGIVLDHPVPMDGGPPIRIILRTGEDIILKPAER